MSKAEWHSVVKLTLTAERYRQAACPRYLKTPQISFFFQQRCHHRVCQRHRFCR